MGPVDACTQRTRADYSRESQHRGTSGGNAQQRYGHKHAQHTVYRHTHLHTKVLRQHARARFIHATPGTESIIRYEYLIS